MYKLVVPEWLVFSNSGSVVLGREKQCKYKLNVLMKIVILMHEIGYSKDK